MDTPSTLFDFDDPPVSEVALAIQFDSIVADVLDLATFSARVKGDFPSREERPPHAPMEEEFGRPSPTDPFRVEVLDRPPTPRFWLLSEDGSRLIQIQSDFFALNWRKLDDSQEYPRYSALRADLARYLEELRQVIVAEGKASDIRPAWFEVTYVNHIVGRDNERPPLSDVLAAVRPLDSDFLPPAEDGQMSERFLIEEDGQAIGRLLYAIVPAFRAADGLPIWVLTLTARLRAREPALAEAFHRLDLGREWVVKAFVDLTTETMHKTWGLQRGKQ